jgi:hypothetical protein
MKATLLYRFRREFDDRAILEVIVWQVPKPVEGCSHPYKYRLFYGFPGQRIIGYDNERPKGDHRHTVYGEEHYTFTGPEKLIDDFLADVAKERSTT